MLPVLVGCAKDRVPNVKFNVAKVRVGWVWSVCALAWALPLLLLALLFCSFPHHAHARTHHQHQPSPRTTQQVLERVAPLVDNNVIQNTIKPCLNELAEDGDADVQYYARQALYACDNVQMQ